MNCFPYICFHHMATYQFTYQEFLQPEDLGRELCELLKLAKKVCANAYAPYSNFKVGAAILLSNGKMVQGINIENASYPVGVCAERSALASAISQFPDTGIIAMAISYVSSSGKSDQPAFPCGMCRQFISECEDRNKKNIRLILSGSEGKIVVIHSAKDLLPFAFGGKDLLKENR